MLTVWLGEIPSMFGADSAYGLGAAVEYPMESGPEAVRIADLNMDGRSDVVVASVSKDGGSNEVLVFPQLADGSLGEPESYVFGGLSWVEAFEVADLDRDGQDDVVVSAWNGGTVLFYGANFGRLDGPYTLDAEESWKLVGGDIDSDGDTDLVAGFSDLYAFDNDGSGVFAPRALGLPAQGGDLAVADVTGDGLADIVGATNQTTWMVAVYPGRGDGEFDEAVAWTYGGEGLQGALSTGDFDGSGTTGVAVLGSGNSPVNMYIFTDGATQVLSSYDLPTSVASEDLDGNGLADIVVGHNAWGEVSVHLQGAEGMGGAVAYPTPPNGQLGRDSLALGDVTGDGCVDVVVADWVYGLLVLPGERCGEELPPDADGDGVPDEDDDCPDAEDPDQDDADSDGIGDACDEAPADTADTGTADSGGVDSSDSDTGGRSSNTGCDGGCAAPTGAAVDDAVLLLGMTALLRRRRE